MGDLIFCELDITSSPSPAKRMYVQNKSLSWFYMAEKYSSVRIHALNSGRSSLWLSCSRPSVVRLQKRAQSGQQAPWCFCAPGIPAFVVSHISCCFPDLNGGNDSTGHQPCGHRLKCFGKELTLAAMILYSGVSILS